MQLGAVPHHIPTPHPQLPKCNLLQMLQDLEGKVHLKSLVVKSIVDYMAEARKVRGAQLFEHWCLRGLAFRSSPMLLHPYLGFCRWRWPAGF